MKILTKVWCPGCRRPISHGGIPSALGTDWRWHKKCLERFNNQIKGDRKMAKEEQKFFVGDRVQTQWGDKWITKTIIRVEWNEAIQKFYYFLSGTKYTGYPVASLRKIQ